MSNALAIASVSAVLVDLLDNALIDSSVSESVGTKVKVTALPPDRIPIGNDEEVPQVNIYMYRVTPNQGWRNYALPSRNSQGSRSNPNPLALDLYYLLSAYGKAEFEAEIVFGFALQAIHEEPVLSRDQLRSSLSAGVVDPSDILPPTHQALRASDLADQVEQIKVVPHTLSTEELSKIWTACQAKFRMTAAFHVSVVLIEAQKEARTPLPVLTVGEPDYASGRQAGVTVIPNMLPPFPTLEAVTPPTSQPAIRIADPAEVLTLTGHHLDGDEVVVRFTREVTGDVFERPVDPGATDTEVQVTMPVSIVPEADDWRAGFYKVAVVVRESGGDYERVTNELPLMLAPLAGITNPSPPPPGEPLVINITCAPKVWKAQRISLIVGTLAIPAEELTVDKTSDLEFKTFDLTTGTYWVRLRVDGVDSILVDRSGALPQFFASQEIDIP